MPYPGAGQDDDDDFRRPTATIFGGGEVCEGDSLPAFIYFTGFGPWTARINDNNGEYASLVRVESPYTLWLKPEKDNIYYVDWVRDRVGREGVTYGADTINVKERIPAEITLDRSAYAVYDPGVTLAAQPSGGIFTGKGVSSGKFYPNIAGTGDSPHLITYSYTAPNQCISRDSVWIDVIHGRGDVYLLHDGDTVNEVCNNEGEYNLAGYNPDGVTGRFELRVEGTNEEIPGHITDENPGDDLARFDPGELEGVYDIAYLYTFKDLTITTVRQVAISSLSTLVIDGIPDRVCKNDEPFRLRPGLDDNDPGATYSFSGNGITGSQQSGFFFHPPDSAVLSGNNPVVLDYRSSLGCRAVIENEISVSFVPDVDFRPGSVCIPAEGGNISFINLTSGKESVETWSWNFGDIGSGSANFSALEEPEHFYAGPGNRIISLGAKTPDGCTSGHTAEIPIHSDPVAGFKWITDCYAEDLATEFINTSTMAGATMDSLIWTFNEPGGEQIGRIAGTPGDDTVRFMFPSVSDYRVRLEAYQSGGCSDEISREILMVPTTRIAAEGFLEDFNDPQVQWRSGSEDENNSWVWGSPDFRGFTPKANDRAWYTNIPEGVTGYTEHSWVESNCLDLGAVNRPFIELELMKSFIPNISGAVLRYHDVPEEGWKTLGKMGEGVGWYNSGTISAAPGGSTFGWGLNTFDPDQDWVKARHDLDMIAADRPVKLRFEFGSIGGQQIGNEGFAFDNVQILRRSRFSILEHFTNSADDGSMHADNVVDAFNSTFRGDVISLQYHTGFPGNDPMNLNNPGPASTRAGTLGVGQVPYALLNGGVSGTRRYDFSSSSHHPDGAELFRASLEVPRFSIDLEVAWMTGHVEITSVVTCRTDTFSSNLQLYTALIESEIDSYTGENSDNRFRNVVLDMLPTPAGELLGGSWIGGQEVSTFNSWDYASFVEDPEDLAVVVFIQDRFTGEILQAAVSYRDPTVGTPRFSEPVEQLRVFPSPSRGRLTIIPAGTVSEAGRFMIFDLSGRMVYWEDIPAGMEQIETDLSHLEPGIYMIRLSVRSGITGYTKFSLIR